MQFAEVPNVSIIVRIHPILFEVTGGHETVEVTGRNVGECLNNLSALFPGLGKSLYDKKGKLHRYFEIYVNSKTSYPKELNMSVEDGDEINIVAAIHGG